MTEDLAALANDHWLAAYRELIRDFDGEWREFGAVHAFLGGIPLPFANGCLVLDPAAADDLGAAIEWLTAAKTPFRVRIDADRGHALLAVPGRFGMIRDPEAMPGMVLQPLPIVPPAPAGVSVVRVDHDTYQEYVDMLIATGLPVEWARPAFPPRLVDDPNAAMFIGRLDGEPVGTSLAVRTGDVAGVYAVGTVDAARRRGVGTAVTWECVSAAREWGCRAVVLQASEMGQPVYRRMGFRSVVDYARFMPPDMSLIVGF